MSINRAIICGYLGRDAETRDVAGGRSMTTFSVATTEKWRDKSSGEEKEETEWHRVTVFGPAATFAADLRKGDKVAVIGSIKTRSWDQDGTTRYSTEIVVSAPSDRVERMSAGSAAGGSTGPARSARPRSTSGSGSKGGEMYDDDIPF